MFGARLASSNTRLETSAEVDAERALTYPSGYPNGWYQVAASGDLEKGDVTYARALGRHLVLFRGERSGRVFALDAHCPHFGANLGVGGRVVDDCIRCPFHGWIFHGSGSLRSVPYLERAPRVRARSWPVTEYHGMICVYYDGAGGDAAPPYELPSVAEIESGHLVYRGRHDAGTVRMHLVEFAENSVDYRHFDALHGQMRLPWTQVPIPFVRINHAASWEVDAEFRHRAVFKDHASLTILGREIPHSSADASITFIGPGGIVMFRFEIAKLGAIVLFQTHTPLAPLCQHVMFHWFASRNIPRIVVWYVVGSWINQWRADVSIWENKIYRHRPPIVRGDGPVHEMRRWYQQFYP